jgi:hypothetical protein
MQVKQALILSVIILICFAGKSQNTNKTIVPFANNAYTSNTLKEGSKTRVYFYVVKPTKLNIKLEVKAADSTKNVLVDVDGNDNRKPVKIYKGDSVINLPFGSLNNLSIGYHFVEIFSTKKSDAEKSIFNQLIIEHDIPEAIMYNKSNYMGAASTHLRYSVPEDSAVKWFYTEVKVPDEVKNSVNAYYETNGFHSGYGGIQINNPNERRFIFSIWSLFKTDDPKQIPIDYIVHLNKKGNGVFTGDFGDEGSGGHSHLVFPWKTNTTYRFLTGIAALKGDSATYVGYYAAPNDGYQWHLLSKWTQHKTDTKTGFKHLYAFVENFGDNGDDFFKAYYGNQWAITFNGTWMELTEAKFTTTANNKTHQRFDYGAGVEDGKFYMFTGGFKKMKNINAGDVISRQATGKHIEIDFKKLEGLED